MSEENIFTPEMEKNLKNWSTEFENYKTHENGTMCTEGYGDRGYSIEYSNDKEREDELKKVCSQIDEDIRSGKMKPKQPKINMSVKINTLKLKCKNCGLNLNNFVPKEWNIDTTDILGNLNKSDKTTTITNHTFVSSTNKCPHCGSNTFDAEIGLIVDAEDSNKNNKENIRNAMIEHAKKLDKELKQENAEKMKNIKTEII